MKVGICAIIKDCKSSYLNEWLNWHRLIGVDCFYIYDNDSAIPIQDVILNMNGVEVIPFPGVIQQLPAYNDCITKRQIEKDCDWLAFVDDDEFIVIEKGDIKEFLSKQRHSGICLNWILFGPSEEGTDHLSQIQKYTKHIPLSITVNNHIKTIVRVGTVNKVRHPHYVEYKNGYAVDIRGHVINGPFTSNPVHDTAWINHYHCRSRKEYAERIIRGRSDTLGRSKMESFDIMEAQVTDTSTKIQEIYNKLTS